MGKYFLEKCLTFGCISSVRIYDRLAKLLVWIATLLTFFPVFLGIQHLDDLAAVGPAGSDILDVFYETYKKLCSDIGVSLASTDNPEKAFAPTTRGTLLGVVFDTEKWLWYLSGDKVDRYLNDIKDLSVKKYEKMKVIKSVIGKILYVVPLIPRSELHVSRLHILNNVTEDLSALVPITEEVVVDLNWWITIIRLTREGLPIPSHHGVKIPPMSTRIADSDAAGGSLQSRGRGLGAVCGNAWTFVMWSSLINSEQRAPCCGNRWRSKLSFLEVKFRETFDLKKKISLNTVRNRFFLALRTPATPVRLR